MIRALFAPVTPADVFREERERVARKKPHLALATVEADPRPDPDMFAWHDIGALLARERRT